MKVKSTPELSNLTNLEQVQRYATLVLRDIIEVVNGQITFTDNIRQEIQTVTFSASNTEVAISHALGRVPTGVLLIGASVALQIYDGDNANTTSQVFLKSSAIGTARVMLI